MIIQGGHFAHEEHGTAGAFTKVSKMIMYIEANLKNMTVVLPNYLIVREDQALGLLLVTTVC